jgi:polysaccharide pyruvyl transferase WcaK-like protein
MPTEPKLIGLFGLLGSGNFGNDGSLESMLLFLRRIAPQERLQCICSNPAEVEKAFGLDAIPIYYDPRHSSDGRAALLVRKVAGKATLWFHALRHLRRLKVLIVPGMGILDDFGVGPLAWPFDILVWFVLARLLGVKVILVSIGAGPIHHPLSRLFMKAAARTAHYRSYRDEISRSFMASIGLDVSRDKVFPDVAFSLPAPANIASGEPPLTVGVGVMTYFSWNQDAVGEREAYDAYIAKMTAYIEWLLSQGHCVRILIGEESDNRAVEDVFRALRAKNLNRLDERVKYVPAHTIHDVMQQLTDVDVVVATRYHNVICALRMGKPTISVGYAEKNDVLLADMGLADFCQRIERLDVDTLRAQTKRLISDRAVLERKICEVRGQFESKLREQESLLTPFIVGSSR